MSEEEIKQAVEDIYRLEEEADIARDQGDDFAVSFLQREMRKKEDVLERAGIDLWQYDEEEVCCLSKDEKPYLVFDYANWQWRAS